MNASNLPAVSTDSNLSSPVESLDDVMSSSDAIYEVEKILETRKVKQRREYLIRWKGYDESADTWEPAENLNDCIEVLQEFHSSRGEEVRKPKRKTKGSFEYVDPKCLRPKDSFWDDLESGKVDVFATDMYSRAKRVNSQQPASEAKVRPRVGHGDRWWSTGGTSDSEFSDGFQEKSQRTLDPTAKGIKPFVGICSETMKRATFAMTTHEEMESGELTDSDSNYTNSEGRRRMKKKKHRHEREHNGGGKKHRKKERKEKEKEVRRKERRHLSGESGSGETKPVEVDNAAPPPPPEPVKKPAPVRAPRLPPVTAAHTVRRSPLKTARNPTAPRSSPAMSPAVSTPTPANSTPSTAPSAAPTPAPTPAPVVTPTVAPSPAPTAVPPPAAPVPAAPSEPSDDEMSEADLCIVEETGESPAPAPDCLTVVDEVGADASAAAAPAEEKEKEKEKEEKPGEEKSKLPPLPVRFPVPLKPRGQTNTDKRPPEAVPTAIAKKRRFHDPMWDELDTFPVLHSLEELEKAHNDDIKRLAVKVTLEELAETVKLGDTWKIKYALEKDDCPSLDNAEPSLVMLAAQRGFDDILEMLLSKKVDVNRPNSIGVTPLMCAAEGGFITTTSILLTCGAHMNAINSKGETAMIRAVKRGHTKTVKKLLDSGANFNAMVSENRHAVALARQMNHSELDSLISRHERYVESQIEEKAKQSLETFGRIVERILPVHVLSFWEAEEFHIWFTGRVYPVKPGEGNLLFLANAVFNEGEVRCQLRGECFVEKVMLNDVEQQSVTKAGRFVMSLSPLHDGSNKCTILTKPVPHPSLRCIVTAYRVRLAR